MIALLAGSLFAASEGLFNWSIIQQAAWITWPKFTVLHYGINFSGDAILTFVLIYLILTSETTVTWFAMSAVTQEPITNRQWNRGLIGKGLTCLISTLLDSTPMTGYSTNAGIVSITRVAIRRVFLAVGIWFAILGFIGN